MALKAHWEDRPPFIHRFNVHRAHEAADEAPNVKVGVFNEKWMEAFKYILLDLIEVSKLFPLYHIRADAGA